MIDFSHVTRDYFGDFDDPSVINSGWCFVWAWLAYLAAPGARLHSYARYPGGGVDAHAWVSVHGLHHDAETPRGGHRARRIGSPSQRQRNSYSVHHGHGSPTPTHLRRSGLRPHRAKYGSRPGELAEVATMLDARWTSQGLMPWPRALPAPTFGALETMEHDNA